MADYMTVFSVDEGEFGGAGYSAGRHGLLLDGPQVMCCAILLIGYKRPCHFMGSE